MSSEDFSLRLSDSDTENQAQNDVANRTQELAQRQSSTEESESGIPIQNFSASENSDSSTENRPGISSEISHVFSRRVRRPNYTSNSPQKLLDSSSKSSDSSEEFLGFESFNEISLSEQNKDNNDVKEISQAGLMKTSTPVSQQSSRLKKNDISSDFESFNQTKSFRLNYSSDSATEFLSFSPTSSQRNLHTINTDISSNFEPTKKKPRLLSSSSSDSSVVFLGFKENTNIKSERLILRKNKNYVPTSSKSKNQRKKKIMRRKRILRIDFSSDSSSSDEGNLSSSTNTTNSQISKSRKERRHFKNLPLKNKGEKIRKLKNFLKSIGVDVLSKHYKHCWKDCQLNLNKVYKRIQNPKTIQRIVKNPLEFEWEMELYMDSLELNTEAIISLNERVTRSRMKSRKLQNFQKYGNSFKRLKV